MTKISNVRLLYLAIIAFLVISCDTTKEIKPSAPAPTMPDALSAEVRTGPEIKLNWLDQSDNEIGFRIERSADSSFSEPLLFIDVNSNTTEYVDIEVGAYNTYYYRVKARGSANDSKYTKSTSAKLGIAPDAPQNLTADVQSANTVNLYWEDKSDNETGFNIERSEDSTFVDATQTFDVAENITEYVDSDLEDGKTFYYRIQAIGDNGNSDYTNVANAIIEKVITEKIYGTNAVGKIPLQLEDEMYLGLSEKRGYKWMEESGVPWTARYMYLANGWADNWGWGDYTGNLAYQFMLECDEMGALPVLEFYILTYLGEAGVSDFYEKTTDADLMNDLFSQYRLLLSRAKEYGKPVAILIEADGFAFLQRKTDSDPSLYAAIADSDIPELADMPNTVAGWGLAFLELKEKMGCDNVTLGMHIGAWASGKDISHQPSADIATAVNDVYNFLAPLGLAPNETGIEYDFLVGDPLDRDADFYRVNHNQNKWWDMDTTAAINTLSFNRYAEWLRQWNVKSGKRWMLWQIPLGNKHNLNTFNKGGAQEGYKDNRVEYFLGDDYMRHLARYADAGVFALLFGIGQSGQADYLNDYDDNGELYMKARGANFFENGGMKLQR